MKTEGRLMFYLPFPTVLFQRTWLTELLSEASLLLLVVNPGGGAMAVPLGSSEMKWNHTYTCRNHWYLSPPLPSLPYRGRGGEREGNKKSPLVLAVLLVTLATTDSLVLPFPTPPFPILPFPTLLPFQVATLEFSPALLLATLLVFPVLFVPTAETLEEDRSGQSIEFDPVNPFPPFIEVTVLPVSLVVVIEVCGVVVPTVLLDGNFGASKANLVLACEDDD